MGNAENRRDTEPPGQQSFLGELSGQGTGPIFSCNEDVTGSIPVPGSIETACKRAGWFFISTRR